MTSASSAGAPRLVDDAGVPGAVAVGGGAAVDALFDEAQGAAATAALYELDAHDQADAAGVGAAGVGNAGPALAREQRLPIVQVAVDVQRDRVVGFTKCVPCGDCMRHWKQIIAEMPPDLSSSDAYFAWTVAAHNAVNRRLGKPEMPLPEARAIHSTGMIEAASQPR